MNTRRNDPCPCGSGKKFKHCHGKPTRQKPLSSEDTAWRRLRAALDGFPTTMLRFVRNVYGDAALAEAWDEFHLWAEDASEFDPNSPHLQVFMPWFFHRWSPDPAETLVADTALHGREPTRVLLERRARRLDPLLKGYLEACIVTPFTFHEILNVDPGRGFLARDVFTGDQRQALEHSASRTMERGDVLFGQLVTTEGVTLMEACAPHVLPAGDKIELVDLREHLTANGPLDPEGLCGWDMELREEYLYRMEVLRSPPTPQLHNTDGEPVVFHRLSYEIPSAQEVFDALKHLAFDETEEELLEEAGLNEEGQVRSVSFAWKAAGNAVHESWDNTVLGHIEIEANRMEVNVNSKGRATRFREIVEDRYPAARHLGTEIETVEEGLARRKEEGEAPADADLGSLADDPEVQARIQAMLAEHYENWIEQEIPALGGLSPTEAVKDKSGREKVEALITQIERHGRGMSPPLDEAITRRMRESLGLYPPPS